MLRNKRRHALSSSFGSRIGDDVCAQPSVVRRFIPCRNRSGTKRFFSIDTAIERTRMLVCREKDEQETRRLVECGPHHDLHGDKDERHETHRGMDECKWAYHGQLGHACLVETTTNKVDRACAKEAGPRPLSTCSCVCDGCTNDCNK